MRVFERFLVSLGFRRQLTLPGTSGCLSLLLPGPPETSKRGREEGGGIHGPPPGVRFGQKFQGESSRGGEASPSPNKLRKTSNYLDPRASLPEG